MRIISIIDTTNKKAVVMILSIALITLIGAGFGKFNDPEIASPFFDNVNEDANQSQSSVKVTGGIDTTDGKDLLVGLTAGSTNNFGKRDLVKGEVITWTIESEQERILEIGIMSVSTKKVISELVKSGTGAVTLTIPEDGDYRIYVKNNSVDDAKFLLKLDKKLEGPIV